MRTLGMLGLMFLLAFFGLFAQEQPQAPVYIQFENEQHNFGEVKEADGDAVHRYEFRNISDQPIKLSYVKPGCGCTASNYTRDVIAPNGKGFVSAEYKTKGRPGAFSKAITVRATPVTNLKPDSTEEDVTKSQTILLRFSGNVIPKPKGPEDLYPYEDGHLRYSTNHVPMGRLASNAVGTGSMTLYNPSDLTLTLKNIELPPSGHVTYELLGGDRVLQPKDTVVIRFSFDAAKSGAFDFTHQVLYLETDDPDNPKKRVYVSANIYEDFSHLNDEQRKNAARMSWDNTVHDFGDRNEGESLSTTFTLTNSGMSELLVRQLKSNCPCVTATAGKMKLGPGESTPVKLTYDTRGRSGVTAQTVTVIANDPQAPSVRLIVKANIKAAAQPEGKPEGKP